MKWTFEKLEEFGRIRLSKNFYMREFLHSEVAQIFGLLNAPENAELAVNVGRQLCTTILEPIQNYWGKVHIRSGYRSPEVNNIGNLNSYNCASNENNQARHIWDALDGHGLMGGTVCLVLPSYQEFYEKTGDWTSLAWWIHRQVEDYDEMCFFKNQCAFNIRWYEGMPAKTIKSHVANPATGDKKHILSKGRPSRYFTNERIESSVETARNIANGRMR